MELKQKEMQTGQLRSIALLTVPDGIETSGYRVGTDVVRMLLTVPDGIETNPPRRPNETNQHF